MTRSTLFILLALVLSSCSGETVSQQSDSDIRNVRTGAEMFLETFPEELQGKRLGLVMNPTARVGDVHMLDTLLALGHNITALFAPEHGFRGNFGAGEKIVDGIDEASGLPVFSLYGANRKPTSEMLATVDVLIFDMQDVGARFYTYISTLGLVIEAASEAGVDIWVLDRPNPAGGDYVAGWMLDPKHTSFVGAFPIPIAHGLTMGELARMMVGERWVTLTNSDFQPKVVEMDGWDRTMKWPDTGLNWVAPSPNLPTWQTAYVYLGTCIFEGSTLSEGRGTSTPFMTLGGPDLYIPAIDIEQLSARWGVEMSQTTFTPVSIADKAPNPKHRDQLSSGVQISNDVSNLTDPVAFGLDLFRTAMRNTTSDSLNNFRYRLAGTDYIDEFLKSDVNPAENWRDEVQRFVELRKPYLLY